MVHIDKDGLYGREDLAGLLKPLGIDADFFVGRLKPRKVFRQAFLGADILAAMQNPPEGADLVGETRGGAFDVDAILARAGGKGDGRRPGRKPSKGLRRLTAADTEPRPVSKGD